MQRTFSLHSSRYFKKVLVANRGEIACRVIKTCKRLGIPTVAIYSTADAKAKHTLYADEAFCVGPPQTSESYLRIDKILDVIKRSGADAVHPGYGFLSENWHFSKALNDINVAFVGPSETAIQAMGDKIESKKLAKKLGVNTIPGFDGEIENEKHLLEVAHQIGYPVMMKASAGGGGKGMRIACNDEEAVQGFRLSKTEAKASFGDDRMLVEKFIEQPRHIEIQVLGDKLGNVIYLPERECSIQRRNQKVIEEAPSTFIDPATRKAMGEQAVMLAKGVNYHTAGTVEMMVDKDRNFYFLEMNTRLQVEHPITELITGVDLVEEMLRAAAGLPLATKQSDVRINGWATESRVYAEDPLNNFLPVIGRLHGYSEPTHIEGVRVDSGILEGSEISLFYDPLISKLCTWGPTREISLSRMAEALDHYVIRGLQRTNVNFLRDLMTHPRYVTGNITTKFIEEEFPKGYPGHALTETEEKELICVSAVVHTLKSLKMYGKSKSHQTQDSSNLAKRWVVTHKKFTAFIDIEAQADAPYLNTQLYLPHEVFGSFKINFLPLDREANRDHCVLPFEVPLEADLLKSLCNPTTSADDFHHHRSRNNAPTVNAQKIAVSTKFQENSPVVSYSVHPENGENRSGCVQVVRSSSFHYDIQYMGSSYTLSVMTPLEYQMFGHMLPPPVADFSKELRSPMPGVVVEVLVKPGDEVKAGQAIVVLEAMKMRNVLNATSEGKVREILVPLGESVEDGTTLVLFN